jgi:hypothetical protein
MSGSATFIDATPYMTPTNYMYVDPSYSGSEDGGPYTPYNTMQEGINAIPAVTTDNPKGGRLWLYGTSYTPGSAVSFTKPMEVTSYMGNASINNKLTLKYTGYMRVISGSLKVSQ